MSKKILYLTFYLKPDICAGSFRNSPLLEELAKQAKEFDVSIDVFTTPPQRYSTFSEAYLEIEENDNVRIERIVIPKHQSGFKDQIKSFYKYYREVLKRIEGKEYDLVFASSSRLFTAYLGYKIAKKRKIPLYLDVRDIFIDTINDVIQNPFVKLGVLPVLKNIEKKTFAYATHINLISAGFQSYFEKYKNANYTYFTNGIDDVFIEASKQSFEVSNEERKVKTIVYAGNIGEGQGLHKVVPQAAKLLEGDFEFHIIGDGGAKKVLEAAIKENDVKNVQIKNPVNRQSLIEEYLKADYLFIHLNDYEAFKKVLPSKVFELGVFNKIIIAGVAGYANEFFKTNLPSTILFSPGNYTEMVRLLKEKKDKQPEMGKREAFIENFNRTKINQGLANSILSYIS